MTLPRELPMLDGLRGAAALAVLISHAANAGMLPQILGSGFGRVGVAIFYSLSGFLMAHVCFHRPVNLDTLKGYGVARAARVLPLFYVVVLTSIVMLMLFGWNFYSIENARDAALNLLLLRGDRVLWSIPVEVQFYVIFVGIWWAYRRGQTALAFVPLLALGAVIIGADIAGLWPVRDNLLPFWLHLFLIGIMARIIIGSRYASISTWFQGVAGWWLAAVILAMVIILPPGLREALGQPSLPVYRDPVVIAIVPLLLFVCCAGHPLFRWLEAPVLRWFGLISYSLYLLHWPVVVAAQEIDLVGKVGSFPAFIIVFTIATAISAVSQRMIESPAQAAVRDRLQSRRGVLASE